MPSKPNPATPTKPAASTAIPTLNSAQINLLILVIKKAQSNLSTSDWENIAVELGCSHAAAKERFRYLMEKLNEGESTGGSTGGKRKNAGAAGAGTPGKRERSAVGEDGDDGGSGKKGKITPGKKGANKEVLKTKVESGESSAADGEGVKEKNGVETERVETGVLFH